MLKTKILSPRVIFLHELYLLKTALLKLRNAKMPTFGDRTDKPPSFGFADPESLIQIFACGSKYLFDRDPKYLVKKKKNL